ncbi:hypothetical protein [Glutamicibacter ardleyensis]|uniref:hypothetical protein n=1 Tax=Glutamicibacter ardleyensis TaxID=225894 RepID=UPI003FD3CD59
MNTPELHTHAIQRLNELLHCPIAQRHLAAYGWVSGMPVVFAQGSEMVEDVMGFISIHGRAVLLVLTDAPNDELQLWHVTVPSPIFTRVPPLPSGTTLAELCVRHSNNRLMPFRVAFWAHSAAIHQIPLYVRSDNSDANATPAPGTH